MIHDFPDFHSFNKDPLSLFCPSMMQHKFGWIQSSYSTIYPQSAHANVDFINGAQYILKSPHAFNQI